MAEKLPRAKELRALPPEDVRAQLQKLRQEAWQHRLKVREGAAQHTALLRTLRRQIARVQTVLAERREASR